MRPIIDVKTPPNALLLVDLPRAKQQCRIIGNERDAEITDAINTARAWVQERLQAAVGEQTLVLTYLNWCGSARLPFKVTTLVSVKVDGVAVDPLPALAGQTLTLAAAGKVEVEIVTGYKPDTLPPPVKSAMLLLIADLVRNPAAQVQQQLYENKALENLLSLFVAEVPL